MKILARNLELYFKAEVSGMFFLHKEGLIKETLVGDLEVSVPSSTVEGARAYLVDEGFKEELVEKAPTRSFDGLKPTFEHTGNFVGEQFNINLTVHNPSLDRPTVNTSKELYYLICEGDEKSLKAVSAAITSLRKRCK